MKILLPNKKRRGEENIKSKSEISRQQAVDIIKISKYSGAKSRESFGHKTLTFMPDFNYINKKTGVPKKRFNKLIKDGYIDNKFGYIPTMHAFIQVWLYFGADPFFNK